MARCPGDRYILADRLIKEFGSLKAVLEAREEQLRNITGLGNKSVAMIRMVIPFVKRWERMAMQKSNRIGTSSEAKHYCRSLVSGMRNEQFYVICLNAGYYVLGEKKISDGSLSEVNAYPRVVMETALNYNAHSILLCHNHPGGTDFPSGEDISSTLKMQELLKGVGIILLDHMIVSGSDTYSMLEHGDIRFVSKA